jgi:hypothetical protein
MSQMINIRRDVDVSTTVQRAAEELASGADPAVHALLVAYRTSSTYVELDQPGHLCRYLPCSDLSSVISVHVCGSCSDTSELTFRRPCGQPLPVLTPAARLIRMPVLLTKIEGKGNGIKTVVPNMSDIARSLARPAACELGASSLASGALSVS